VERAVALGASDWITLEELEMCFGLETSFSGPVPAAGPGHERRGMLAGTRKDTEREQILMSLEEHDWNKMKVAACLGVSRATLWRKMKEHGLVRP
jgi:transcriptional regulator of acetoin/glycerol metabolism